MEKSFAYVAKVFSYVAFTAEDRILKMTQEKFFESNICKSTTTVLTVVAPVQTYNPTLPIPNKR